MARNDRDLPWIEKHRPKTIDDVASQDEVISVLKQCLLSGDLPHLLFYGPPGTGKTSTILALARDLYGTEFRQRVLELNASDERGISVIRDKVKTFSQLTSNQGRIRFRIVVLDEADSMTRDAQTALRRIMEKYTKTTRFCLICNYVTKIIPPLNSRCSKFRFKPVPTEVLLDKLDAICVSEGVSVADKETDLRVLIEACEGDMRRAVTLLQIAHRICPADTSISEKDIGYLAGVIPDDVIDEVYSESSFEGISDKLLRFRSNGYSGDQLLTQLLPVVIADDSLTELNKATLLQKFSVYDGALKHRSSELFMLLQLGRDIVAAKQ